MATKLRNVRDVKYYEPGGVYFDGTNDWLSNGDLSNAVDNNFLLISYWFNGRTDMSDYARSIHFNSTGSVTGNMTINVEPNGFFSVSARDAGNVAIFQDKGMQNIRDNIWHHYLVSVNMNDQSISHIFLDDALQTPDYNTWVVNGVIPWPNFDVNSICAHSDGTKQYWKGDLQDLYTTNEYLDLSIESNRRKFITPDLKPVYLGDNGELPTGTQPLVFFSGSASDWNSGINKGSGGIFTMNGSVTDSAGPGQ